MTSFSFDDRCVESSCMMVCEMSFKIVYIDSDNFSQRFHLSSINFTLVSKLWISESSTYGIRFLKKDFFLFAESPKQKQGFCLFSVFFFFKSHLIWYRDLYYVVILNSIPFLANVRHHLLPLALKSKSLLL